MGNSIIGVGDCFVILRVTGEGESYEDKSSLSSIGE